MNKATLTDAVSIALIAGGAVLSEPYRDVVLYSGLFAFSGAVTNQLAIHMLFERVPFLYGSGIIEKNFQSFKDAIKAMMMEQFFSPVQLERFFIGEENKIDFAGVIEKMDFSPAYDALVKTVMESRFGGALAMFGGESALEEMREGFTEKLRAAVMRIVSSGAFRAQLQEAIGSGEIGQDLSEKIGEVIDRRLEELTPKAVKHLVRKLIKEHLGWLVVWGGVFGGAIGALSAIVL